MIVDISPKTSLKINLGVVIVKKGLLQILDKIFEKEQFVTAFKEAVAGPAAAAWIADNTAKGLPAQELYDLLTGMIGK